MATQTATASRSNQNSTPEQQLQTLRELYADAPELGRVALENGLPALKRELAAATAVQTAGRKGTRQGKVSEFTIIVPFAKGGAKRLRGLLELLRGNFKLADAVGTVHDMRFVFLDNDTKLLFATAYDGDWDAYIDDFATKIPDALDLLFCNSDGWPGIRNPKVKDYLVEHRSQPRPGTSRRPTSPWRKRRRSRSRGAAVEEFLDRIQ